MVSTIAGLGTPGFADGDGATALFNSPTGIALAPDGSLVVTDSLNHRLRRIRIHDLVPRPRLSALISDSILPGVAALMLEIAGEAGARMRLESSGDLAVWTLVREMTLDAEGKALLHGAAMGEKLFYRVVAPE
jgi:hypothetical protein